MNAPPPRDDKAVPRSVVIPFRSTSDRTAAHARTERRGSTRRCTVTPLFPRSSGARARDFLDRPDRRAEAPTGPLATREDHHGAPRQFYVIYDHPRDYPDQYVVRRWSVWSGPDEQLCVRSSNLETVREWLAARTNLTRTEPYVRDSPVILEVWV